MGKNKSSELYLFNSLESKYCLFVLSFSLVLGYFLIPSEIFHSSYMFITFVFIFLFALNVMCIIRNIKEKVVLARTYKSSLVGLIGVVIGLGALQICGVGAPVCGATVGMGVASIFFPSAFLNLPSNYAPYFLGFSIVFQLISLYFMHCFKKMRKVVR